VSIVLSCECGRKLQISEEFAGREGQCPSCGRTMLIPLTGDLVRSSSVVSDLPSVSASLADAVTPQVDAVAQPADDRLTNHGGGTLRPDSDFFADAPEEIGPILSAHTTLTADRKPWSAGGRLIAVGLTGIVGLAVGSLIVIVARPRAEFWHFLWPTAGCLLGALLARVLTRFAHVCTYVGRDGVARFNCAGSRERIVGSQVFLFRDAAELRTAQMARYNHGAYQGTDYTFTWTESSGRTRYLISGTYRNAKGLPPTTDAFHYGRSAEKAWTTYLLAQAQDRIEKEGAIVFNLQKGRSLRLAPGSLTILLGGEPVEWRASEIETIVADKATVKIKRIDAQEGWFSATGVVKFPLDSLGNAQFFFRIADLMLGVRAQ
jgi:hypothetical protein